MTARYDAEAAMIRDHQPPPFAVRIGHDADELRRLADWLDILREERPTQDAVALDYFRLSAQLLAMSSNAHDFALSLTRVIP